MLRFESRFLDGEDPETSLPKHIYYPRIETIEECPFQNYNPTLIDPSNLMLLQVRGYTPSNHFHTTMTTTMASQPVEVSNAMVSMTFKATSTH